MRQGTAAVAVAAALAALLCGCQTSKMTLLPDEDGKTVGAVVLLDPETGAEQVEIKDANIEAASSKSAKPKSKTSRKGGFVKLFGVMPRPAIVKELKFETGLTAVAPESLADLQLLLDTWQKEQGVSEMQIVGYTDTVGGALDNDVLSLKRAEAVRMLLINAGFKFTDDNCQVLGRGERDLAVRTGDEVDEPRNRRVVVLIR
jgi:outer membrane protein OmpA-like peptidoglycan-associated protein